MTYQDAVGMLKIRYSRYNSINKKELPKIENVECLFELSVVQSELQDKYYLSTKNSRNNTTAQLTAVVGTDKYYAGTTATTIPSDIKQVLGVYLDDSFATELLNTGLSDLRTYSKSTGKPYGYTIYLQNSSMVFELDSLPDSAYSVTIIYVPRYDLFYSDNTANLTWSDYSDSATGWGGSFKLPLDWHGLLIDGALANITGDTKLLDRFQYAVDQKLKSMPMQSGTNIPYDNSVERTGHRPALDPGQDTPRTYYH